MKTLFTVLAAAAMMMSTAPASAATMLKSGGGFVYVMTNRASGNSIIQYARDGKGQLTALHEVSTQGLGSGGTLDPLTSQDSLVLGAGGRLLLAVNAGSDEVSLLRVTDDGPELVTKAPSGGDFPNTVARFEDLVYVVNRDSANIAGFRLCAPGGALEPIAGSIRPLPGGAGAMPGDVHFTPDGAWLVVTETGTNQIDLFPIDAAGLPGAPVVTPSEGVGPFGFRVRSDGIVIVTEAMTASVSSYDVGDGGALDTISAAVANGQMASCWISLTPGGRLGFVSNTASATLSSYRIDDDGEVRLVHAVAGATGAGSAPIDSALSRDGRYLYVEDSTGGRVVIFRVDGPTLHEVGSVTGLPTSIQGIAAR